MTDGIKGALQQTAVDLGEAVVKPVVDEVGKALEVGTQSIVQGPQASALDPVVQQKKEDEKQKKIVWAQKVIAWNQKIAEDQKRVRQEKQQSEQQKFQEEQEVKKIAQYKIIEKQQKQAAVIQVQEAQRKTETKKGVGG